MTFLQILKTVSIILGSILSVCYAYQIVYLFIPYLKKRRSAPEEKLHRYAILIAARNEEKVLPQLLESIRAQTYPAELISTFVVADNCTDRTAELAYRGGAVVFSRFNQRKVGKGYALHYLLERIDEHMGLDSFDAFLIFDADNLLRSDYIRQINTLCTAGYDAFCGYRNSKNFGTNWVSAGHALWYLHESIHLNHSRMLLGNPCMVSGTGFGFTRQLLEQCGGWNFFTLTEDIEFSVWCVSRGIKVGYCPEAMLYDEQPERLSQSWRQRTRWSQGGVQVSIRYAKNLLSGICRGGRTAYACLETATLLLWGYGTGALCAFTSLLAAILSSGWAGLWHFLAITLASTHLTGFVIGGITLLCEWRNIRATTPRKLMGLFAFPLYLLTSIPISATALFRKYHWPPIEHTAARSIQELQ